MSTDQTIDGYKEIAAQTMTPLLGDRADITDGAYAQAALAAFQRLVFLTFAPVEQAAQAVYDTLASLGFTGQLTFGYSGGGHETRTQEGEKFVGPFMRVRTRIGELHVLKIGDVDYKLIEWMDGIA